MSTIIQGYQLRTLLLGDQVIKTALTLPASTTGNLYTVAGGNVLVTSLLGVVTTVVQTQACTLSLGTAPTVGTAKVAGIAAAESIESVEVGGWVGAAASAGLAGNLAVSGAGADAGNVVYVAIPFVVAPGYITWTTSATNTGAMTWYLTYVPLDTGASVS